MFPTIRPDGLTVEPTLTGLLVRDELTGASHQLSPIAAAVFRACDGATPVAAIVERVRAEHPEADAPLVWSALDELGSADLLSVRAAPPAAPAVGRRAMLRTMFAATGAAAALGVIGPMAASAAPAQEGHRKRSAAMEQERKAQRRVRRDEEQCKAQTGAQQSQMREESSKADPSFRQKEAASKDTRRQSMEETKKSRESIGLISEDGDWRVPASVDFTAIDGFGVDGQADVYSYSIGGDGKGGACGGSIAVHFDGADQKAGVRETVAQIQRLVGAGTAIFSFNDEPGFEAKLTKADAGYALVDERGTPRSAVVTFSFVLV